MATISTVYGECMHYKMLCVSGRGGRQWRRGDQAGRQQGTQPRQAAGTGPAHQGSQTTTQVRHLYLKSILIYDLLV